MGCVVSVRLTDGEAAAMDVKAADLAEKTFLHVGRSDLMRAALAYYLASSSSTGQPGRPLPPRTRNRIRAA